jgi:hypothetical protein
VDGKVLDHVFFIRNGPGEARMSWGNGYRYEGEWQNDWPHGDGKYKWDMGQGAHATYEGQLCNDLYHGSGKYTTSKGIVKHDGEYVNDRPKLN